MNQIDTTRKNDILVSCATDAQDIIGLVEIAERNELSTDSQKIINVSTESLMRKYNIHSSISTESDETFLQKLKRIAKQIIEAILNTISRLLDNINFYTLSAKNILITCDDVSSKLKGLVAVRRRSNLIQSQRLAMSLYASRGAGNAQEAYRRLINISTQAYDLLDFKSFDNILGELRNASDTDVPDVVEKIRVKLEQPTKALLRSSGVPEFIKQDYSKENCDLYFSGPYLGERYIYSNIPKSINEIKNYSFGVFRNVEYIPERFRLQALSTAEMWEIIKIARVFADHIHGFDEFKPDLDNLVRSSKQLTENTESLKAVATAAIYPIAIKGIQCSVIDNGINTTTDILDYCKKSIKLLKTRDDETEGESGY